MYVTRKNMTSAVTSMNKQLEHVSGALSTTKKHLTQRLDAMTRTLDENTELQESIKDAVSQVRGEVERSVLEIENVQRLVEGLEVKIDEVQDKQNFANQGIIALVRCVESLRNKSDDRAPELLQGFHKWSLKAGQIERSSSSPAVGASPGFKELQYSMDPLLRTPSTSSSTPEVTPSTSGGERVGRIGMANKIVIASNTPRTKMQTKFSTEKAVLGTSRYVEHSSSAAILVLDLDALPTVKSVLICKVMQFLFEISVHSQPVEALVSIHFQGAAILVLDLNALLVVEIPDLL
ncbi:unnamed protein product [Sphagnum tenellum]